MGISEKFSKFQAAYLVFTSNERSRKINKNLPSLAPRPEDQAPKQCDGASTWNLVAWEDQNAQKNRDSVNNSVNSSYLNFESLANFQDPIRRAETCPIPEALKTQPADSQVPRRMSRRREPKSYGGVRTKQQRHSMPASRSTLSSTEYHTGFQITGPRDQNQHQRSNSHDNYYLNPNIFDTQNSTLNEVQNWDIGLPETFSNPSLYDLQIPEETEMEDDWQPRTSNLNSADSGIFGMADSGFISWADEFEMQRNIQDLANCSTPQSTVGTPVFPQIASDFLGEVSLDCERQKSLQSLEGITVPIHAEAGFQIDCERQKSFQSLEAAFNEQVNQYPFNPDWTWAQLEKHTQITAPLQKFEERHLQIRRKKSAPLEPLFSCPQCTKYNGERAFKRKDHLDQHLKTAHHMAPEDLFPAFCKYNWCEKSETNRMGVRAFSSSRDFTDHLRNAHDESLFNCEFLGCVRKGKKGYAGKANLINHQRKMHGFVLRNVI